MSNYSKHKDRDPADTIFDAQSILNDAGVFTTVAWVDSQVTGLASNRVTIYPTTLGTNGKGTDELYATASGYAELLERIQNNMLSLRWAQVERNQPANGIGQPDEVPMSVAQIVAQNDPVLAHLFNKYGVHGEQRKSDFLVSWLECFSESVDKDAIPVVPYVDFRGQRIVYLPACLVQRVYGSNGMSAGNTIEEAMVQGISEVFERYANSMLVKEQCVPPLIPEDALRDYSVWDAIEAIRSTGRYDVKVFDCSLGKGLPVVGTMIIDKKLGCFGMKLGAHPSFAVSVERTLTESFQGRNRAQASSGCRLGSKADAMHLHNMPNIMKTGVGVYPATMLAAEPDWQFKPWTQWEGLNNREYLQRMLQMLLDMGFSPVMRDVSHLGFCSCVTMVPGMSEMYTLDDMLQRLDRTNGNNVKAFARFPDLTEAELRRLLNLIRFKEGSSIESGFDFITMRPLRGQRFVTERVGAFVALRLGDYKVAQHYFGKLMRVEADEREQVYFRCFCEYARYRQMGLDHEQTSRVLECLFESEAAQRVCDEASDMQVLLSKVFPMVSCFDCEHCELAGSECANLQESEVMAKLREAMAGSEVSQEHFLAELNGVLGEKGNTWRS